MCLKPITLTKKYAGTWCKEFTVPCGKCVECVKDNQNEFVIRTVEEQKKRGTIVFVTLTYNEDAVPIRFNEEGEIDEETGEVFVKKYRSLRRQDVIDWKKRVCQKYFRTYGIRLDFGFLLCGEYGPKTKRPHYHGMLLGLTRPQAEMFKQDWEEHNGFVCFKYVPTIKNDVVKVARYCSKYICKLKEMDLLPDPEAEKPRKLASIGYGMPEENRWAKMKRYYLAKDFIDYNERRPIMKKEDRDRLVNEIIKRRRYNLDGWYYKLPNYYRRKIFYAEDITGKLKTIAIQRVITRAVQLRSYEDFVNECEQLKTDHNLRTMTEAVDMYNMIQDEMHEARGQAIWENNLRYQRKCKIA